MTTGKYDFESAVAYTSEQEFRIVELGMSFLKAWVTPHLGPDAPVLTKDEVDPTLDLIAKKWATSMLAATTPATKT